MSFHSMFATDPVLEVDGVEVTYDDIRFLIARAGGANKEFAKVFNALTKPYERQIRNNTLSETKGRNLMAQAYAQTIVRRVDSAKLGKDGNVDLDKNGDPVGWDLGVFRDVNGKSHDATPDLIKDVLLDYPDLFLDLQDISRQAANYQRQVDEADEGNAGPS